MAESSGHRALNGLPNTCDLEAQLSIWERTIPKHALLPLLWRKLWRRLVRPDRAFSAGAVFDGLVVFDERNFPGGGLVHGPDFARILVRRCLVPCNRLCDFASGAGHIGYLLLAREFCDSLCLIDIDERRIQGARYSATQNGIARRVSSYVSDVFGGVPAEERWDVVVANMPHLLPAPGEELEPITFDPGWKIHRRFYAGLKRHMSPGGHVVALENKQYPVEMFREMVEDGGGQVVAAEPARNFRGDEDDRYFVISRWQP